MAALAYDRNSAYMLADEFLNTIEKFRCRSC